MELSATSVFFLAMLALNLLLGIPAWSLLLLTLASLLPGRQARPATGNDAPVRTVVLVPAHNESIHILPTLQCLKAQLQSGDRLLVIADNCNDDTAALAAGAGAEVLQRHDTTRRGKGYALAFGVDALRDAPPDVLVVVDADCKVSPGGISALARQCHQSGAPVQMLDLMVAPEGAGLRTRMLEFAWRVKNHVRPLGSYRIGAACHLMGTGMALPWKLAATARLATGHITEDMKLGVDLAIAGYPTGFFTQASVTSEFPLDASVARAQKSRWEHGHMSTLRAELPPLLGAWLRQPRRATLALAMDLVIPPLALYFVVVVAMLLGNALLAWWLPALVPAFCLALASATALLVAIMLSWQFFARQLLSLRELLTVPLYAIWKIPVYIAYFLNRKSGWTKTTRKV